MCSRGGEWFLRHLPGDGSRFPIPGVFPGFSTPNLARSFTWLYRRDKAATVLIVGINEEPNTLSFGSGVFISERAGPDQYPRGGGRCLLVEASSHATRNSLAFGPTGDVLLGRKGCSAAFQNGLGQP